jgi:hypothetical protein
VSKIACRLFGARRNDGGSMAVLATANIAQIPQSAFDAISNL